MICCLLCLFIVCLYLDTFDFPFGLSEFYTEGAYFLNDYSWSRIQGLHFSTLAKFFWFHPGLKQHRQAEFSGLYSANRTDPECVL